MIDQITSRYQITGVIQQGTAGTLYAAEDKALGLSVAIKVFAPAHETERALFRRTAKVISYISHPNVARVYDYGETAEGLSYVVLERVTGTSVAELLRGGSLPLNDSVNIAASVAEALGALHSAGVLHHDVKPSNIHVDRSGRLKLIDFGLTRRVTGEQVARIMAEALTSKSHVKGRLVADALTYTAPEQVLLDELPDIRTDLFSLGVTLYETLTGRLPFSGKSAEETEEQLLYSGRSPAEVARQLLAAHPQRPSLFNPSVPERLNDIVLKALAKEPERRFQTADELLAALGSVRASVRSVGEVSSGSGAEAAAPGDAPRGGEPRRPQSPMLYFALEGERAHGDVVECGSDVDLLFGYSIPPPEALVAFWGERFEKILRGEAELGVTVIATGFTFRDGVWHRVAKFRGGALVEPVRFYLRAADEVVDGPGFFVTLSLYESVLYQLPIRVRLARSLDAAAPREIAGWALDLDLYEIISEKENTLGAAGAGT